jgi:GNAT superfamily N-acetyltransferase
MSNRPFRVRRAQPSDIPAVVALIRALADFEHLPGPDRAAAMRLQEHAFGPTPRYELLVAEEDLAVVGYAAFFMTYSTFLARPSLYLEDLFVRPESRRLGVGTAFLQELAALAVARDCARFEWTVLDWNVAAQDFYAALGAELLADWRICRVDGEALLRLGARPASK